MEENPLCNFLDHSKEKIPIKSIYYCTSCNLRLCSKCIFIHNSNPNYSSHEIKQQNDLYEKWNKKIKEIEKKKKIINIYDEQAQKNMETKKKVFMENLNMVNNNFRNLIRENINKYKKIEEVKNEFEKKIKKKKEINYLLISFNSYTSIISFSRIS